jgi:F-type H+-transporting ATPase subunit a
LLPVESLKKLILLLPEIKARKMTRNIRSFLLISLTIFFCTGTILAQEAEVSVKKGEPVEKFEAGEFVIEHVSDAYEWHIATFGHTHLSVPLPIILYSSNQGWNFFMSSKFHHGQESYRNFRIGSPKKEEGLTEGKEKDQYEGKIVELNASGEVIDTPFDLSITKTVAGIFVSVIILLLIFLNIAKSAKRRGGKAPQGIQNLFEPIILFVRDDIAKPAIGEKKYERFMPFLLTVFFFILINNLLGLIPIFPFGANVTGNIAVTMVLAVFTFIITTFSTNKHYWKEIYNPDVPWWLKFPVPLMPIVELTGVLTKPFVLMVRLFANMLAGHLIVTVFVSLIFIFARLFGIEAGLGISVVSVLFSVFMLMLDILVSFVQAYVFTFLSAMYFGMASPEHH